MIKGETMNDQLQKFARNELKSGLIKLPEANQLLFKRMYSPKNSKLSINTVVDTISTDRLDWAMQQVQKTLDKFNIDNNE